MMKKLVVSTGAGISAESGMMTYRDAGGLCPSRNPLWGGVKYRCGIAAPDRRKRTAASAATMEADMAEKTDAQVVIGGRTYTLSGYESEEYLLRVAEYLNGKIDELRADPEYARLPVDMRQLLLNLNIADDYFKACAQIDELKGLIDKKENDLYDIKHELVAAQMKLQSAEKKK